MASSTAAGIPTTRGRRKQAKPQRKNVDLENLSSDHVVLTSVAASVGGVGAAGDLCAPPAAAMSPDSNHNHQLLDGTPQRTEDRNCLIVSPPGDGEPRRIFVDRDPGSAGLEGLIMVKVRKDGDDGGQNGDSEVIAGCGGNTSTGEVPQRRQMLRRGLLAEEEERVLQEYMKRSDTAVIFPEPVEQVPLPAAGVGKGISPGSGADVGVAGSGCAPGIGTDYYIKCPQCHKGYPGFQALKEHVESCHPPPLHLGGGDDVVSQPTSPVGSPAPNSSAPGVGYACSQCNTSFLHKDQLEQHELVHSPNAQVSCKVCNKTFANVYRLQRHMISHDESAVLRKFKCPECEKAFKFKHHLKEHIRIHSGEKPFECANCGKRFSHSGSYSSHMTSKKCLVMNLKVGRGGRGGPNSLIDKCPPHHRGAGHTSKRSLTNNSPLNGNTSSATTSSSLNNNSFPPILPKYGDTFLSAVTPRLPGRYSTSTSHPHPTAPSLHSFYMSVAPAMHLNPHPNSGINSYKLPASLSHLLEQLTTSSPPHQPRASITECDKKLEEVVEQERENETENDTQHQEKRDDGGVKYAKKAKVREEHEEDCDTDLSVPEGQPGRQDETCERESPIARSGSRNSPGGGSNSGDLEAVKRILETVNATVTKQLLEANMQKLTSSTSSGSGCPSIASASSPTENGTESNVTEFQKRNSEYLSSYEFLSCRHCQKKFHSAIDLHQHERYLCEHGAGDRRSEGLAAKLEEAVTVKTEEMSLNGGCSGSEDGDEADGQVFGREPATEEEEGYEAESITTTDQVSEDGRKVRVRSLIADEQLAILKGHYSLNPRPKKDELSRIAEKIGFSVRVVQVWFQNTRARDRREGRLVHVPYVPLTTGPVFPPVSLVPSSQPSHLQPMNVSHYSSTSPPLCPSSGAEQPLDLSTKKTQHSLASTPSSSPLRPTSAAAHSDSGEDVGCAMNLSRKSSSSRSPTPNSNAMLAAPFRQLLPFHQSHYPHSSCSSSSIADFRRTPSPMSSVNLQQHVEGLSNGIANGSKLARILAQPPVTAQHRMVSGLTNGINGSTVGLVPMERLVYGADLHVTSRSPLPVFNQQHVENGRACSSSPNSDKRSWKQGHLDGGDITDEADDSGCVGGGNQEIDHTLLMMDEDGSSPNKRHKLSPALSKGLLTGFGGITGLDGEGEGQFICDQCDKAFSKQSSLARHKYEHSGQRPHKCDVCTKAFKHKHHLTEHKRLHSGEKPFQCSKCYKRFSHSGSYSQHMNHRYSYCKPYRE